MTLIVKRRFSGLIAPWVAAALLWPAALAGQAAPATRTAPAADPRKMAAAVEAYVAAFEKGSVDEVVALFAEDATVEDPVGSKIHRGRTAIRAFYTPAMRVGSKLKLAGPVRIARDYAVFPFSVHVRRGSRTMRIDVIDSFRFNDRNQVIEMRAFWGPTNMHME